jgi:hypothetical protein
MREFFPLLVCEKAIDAVLELRPTVMQPRVPDASAMVRSSRPPTFSTFRFCPFPGPPCRRSRPPALGSAASGLGKSVQQIAQQRRNTTGAEADRLIPRCKTFFHLGFRHWVWLVSDFHPRFLGVSAQLKTGKRNAHKKHPVCHAIFISGLSGLGSECRFTGLSVHIHSEYQVR